MKQKNRGRLGSAIIEAVVGVSLLVVGILGILQLLSSSIRYNDIVVGRFVASNLAAEGVEVMKNIVDKAIAHRYPWDSFSFFGLPWGIPNGWYQVSFDSDISNMVGGTATVTNLARISGNVWQEPSPLSLPELRLDIQNSYPTYGYGVGTPTPFRRIVRVEWGASGERVDIEARVYWSVRGKSYTTVVSDRFYKWRQ